MKKSFEIFSVVIGLLLGSMVACWASNHVEETAKTYSKQELNKKGMYLIVRQDGSLKATSNNLNKARELSDEQDSIWLQEHDGELIEMY